MGNNMLKEKNEQAKDEVKNEQKASIQNASTVVEEKLKENSVQKEKIVENNEEKSFILVNPENTNDAEQKKSSKNGKKHGHKDETSEEKNEKNSIENRDKTEKNASKELKIREEKVNQANKNEKTEKTENARKSSKIKQAEIASKQEETKRNIEDNTSNPRKRKALIALVLVLIVIGLILSTVFGVMVSHSNQIASGVSIYGIDVSNLTQTQATEKLEKELSNRLEKEITFTHGDYVTTIQAKSFGVSYPIDSAVSNAYDIGRTGGNIFVDNFKALKALIMKDNIEPQILFDENTYNEAITKMNSELPDRLINSSYQIDGTNLIIANSSSGYKIQDEVFKNNFIQALNGETKQLEIPVEQYEADKVDIDALYNQIHKEPVDASYTTNPYEIKKEENGIDFAISMEKAREIVAEENESYTIPLKVIMPKVTVKTLPQEAFPDLLATYTTTYASSNYNRSSNIALAGKSINNYVLMPGETFSYNDTVGQRTPARGYKEAGVYVNGEVSTDYGGGICQVSSTLYNSVLLSNLEVVSRTNHTFEPAYVPAGQDATVSWKSPDFQFKNNRSYPIRISSKAGGGRITVEIYGLKSDDDYVVKIQSTKTGTIPFSTKYENDPSLPAGTTKVSQGGSNGCTTQTYKILYKNGEEVSRKLINSDTYKPHNQVVLRGTKVVSQPVETPEPQENSDSGNSGNDDVVVTNESAN